MVTVWGLDWNIISFITASAVNCLAPVDSLVIKSASCWRWWWVFTVIWHLVTLMMTNSYGYCVDLPWVKLLANYNLKMTVIINQALWWWYIQWRNFHRHLQVLVAAVGSHLVTVLTNQDWVKTEPITNGRSQIYNDAAVNTGVQKFLNIAILPLEMCIFWSPVLKESR